MASRLLCVLFGIYVNTAQIVPWKKFWLYFLQAFGMMMNLNYSFKNKQIRKKVFPLWFAFLLIQAELKWFQLKVWMAPVRAMWCFENLFFIHECPKYPGKKPRQQNHNKCLLSNQFLRKLGKNLLKLKFKYNSMISLGLGISSETEKQRDGWIKVMIDKELYRLALIRCVD